jgi:hypothetical protein
MPSFCWRFDIKPDMRAYSLTKLFLDNAELADFDDPVLAHTEPNRAVHPDKDKPPVDVVADYLSHVLNYVWKIIQDDLGPQLNHIAMDLRFTTAATWSDQGDALIEQAIVRVWDLKRPNDALTRMSEPEAAAESVRDQFKHTAMFQNGDRMIPK